MSYIENKVINIWIIILIFLMLILVSLSFIKYQPYVLKYGELKEKYVSLYLTDEEISKLNFKLKYNNEIIDYKIIDVDSNYDIYENKLVRNVKIEIDCDKNSYILELYIGIGEEISIWENIYNKYMKGAI